MAAGDVIWCQGFSEPEAGSDLASLKTRAVRDGDRYVVNGQKIWNSYADAPADHCLLLARTDPEVKKQMGISMFLVDMRTPGITVRPIPSMAGKSEFSEIFFDDAVIPVTDRLGDENNGWTLVGEGLAFERIGIARYARANRVLEHLVAYARDTVVDGRPLADDPAVRARLATLAVRIEAAKLLNYGAISIQAAGDVPAIEASIARIHNTQVEQLAGPGRARGARARRACCSTTTRSACSTARCNASGWRASRSPSRPAAPRCRRTSSPNVASASRGAPDVDLNLDDDQRLLAESARQLFERTLPDHRGAHGRGAARTLLRATSGPRSPSSAGPASPLPEDYGGAGYGLLELAVLAEELGRGAVTLAAPVVVRGHPAAAVGRDRPARGHAGSAPLTAGDAVAALALLDPGSGSERVGPTVDGHAAPATAGRCRAPRSRCRFGTVVDVLRGERRPRRRRRRRWSPSPPTRPASSAAPHDTFSPEPIAAVTFTDVAVAPDDVVGERGAAAPLVARALAHLSGARHRVRGRAVRRRARASRSTTPRNREQFGRPIGVNQAVSHQCVDIRVETDAMRVLTHQAAWRLDRHDADPAGADARGRAGQRVRARRASPESSPAPTRCTARWGSPWSTTCSCSAGGPRPTS